MKRFFFWSFVAMLLFGLLFFSLNLFDSRRGSFSDALPILPARLEPDNGFFVLWGFAEPVDVDPGDAAYRARMLELFEATVRNAFFRARYSQWQTRLNASFRRHWQGAGLNFPRLPEEDVCAYAASARTRIEEQRRRYAVPLRRFALMLRAGRIEDFTPLDWDFPSRSLALASATAKLHALSRALDALDGDWQGAGDGLLAAMAAGMKLIASGRTLKVNALGKTLVDSSLLTLASLLNRGDCPPAWARRVLDALPERHAPEFGTEAVRTFAWMNFAHALERIERNKIVDPYLLKDYFREPAGFFALERFVAISGPGFFTVVHALASHFMKKNESAAALRSFWQEVGRLEETPPASWSAGARPQVRLGSILHLGPFWWMRNPLGKMMVRAAVPYTWPVLQHYVYRSHGLKARYDLVRLLARARVQAGSAMSMDSDGLQGFLASAPERDPFSGRPYLFNSGRGMLYSVGQDGQDDGGRETPGAWRDSDIAVPISFMNKTLDVRR
jgi:hypothetical protein